MRSKNSINNPFPFFSAMRDQLLAALFFGVFIFVFLSVFEPFGIGRITFYKPLFILGYGIITFLVVGASYRIIPLLFKKTIDTNRWTTKKNIYFSAAQLSIIAVLNWSYTVTVGAEIVIQKPLLIEFVFYTLSVGILPIVLFTLVVERILFHRHEEEAEKLTKDFVAKRNKPALTPIEVGSSRSKILLDLADLLCIRAEGNYVEIYSLEGAATKKSMIRRPLYKIKAQLENYADIKHCHRSYIVNVRHIAKVTGNARNFSLHLKHIDFSVPVSRNFPIQTIKNNDSSPPIHPV